MITISGRAGTNNSVFVQTFTGAAAAADLPFTVVVICSYRTDRSGVGRRG